MKPCRLPRPVAVACLLAVVFALSPLPSAFSPLLAGEVGAELKEAEGVDWWGFDPKTGRKTWEVSAEKVSPTSAKTFAITHPKILVRGSEYDVSISSDTGTMKREDAKNMTVQLKGSVLVKIADPSNTVIRTETIEWSSLTRLLKSDSAVNVKRTDLEVSGVGLEIEPEKQGKEPRLVKLNKNVKATIKPAESTSSFFSSIGGKSKKLTRDDTPMIVVCQGPMAINRDSRTVSFTDKVQVSRGAFTMTTDHLELRFDPVAKQVKEIQCTGAVQANDGTNGASGDKLSWDDATGLAQIIGTKEQPAQTRRGDATVSAPIIWIMQKEGSVRWSGRAHLFAPAEGTGKIFRFGGGSE